MSITKVRLFWFNLDRISSIIEYSLSKQSRQFLLLAGIFFISILILFIAAAWLSISTTRGEFGLFSRIFDVGDVGFEHHVPNFDGIHRDIALERHLDQSALEFRHRGPRSVNRILINQLYNILALSRRYFD